MNQQIELAKLKAKGVWPKYQVTEKCFGQDKNGIDRLWEPETMPNDDEGNPMPLYYETWQHPAYYMIPVNDAAKEMTRIYPVAEWTDPILAMTPLP